MESTTFYFAIGLLVVLLLIPLVVFVLVRLFVKDEPETDAPVVVAAPEAGEHTTMKDFWQGMVPHLLELRDRLVKAFLAIGIGTALGFYLVNSSSALGQTLPDFMVTQLAPGTKLQAIGVGEEFFTYMQMALVVGIAMAMPVVIYQIVAFFSPGLLPSEKRIVYVALPFVTELFIAGMAFGWFFTIPAALDFLLGYGSSVTIVSNPSLSDFVDVVARLLLWNGIVFQLPAVIFLLARLGLVTAKQLGETRRYAMVVITIVAALITPTGDPFNLLLLAVPMYLLYELGIILARFAPRKQTPPTGEVPAAA